jgi:DNA mismatch endonuclease, patch repair protein
VRARVNVGYWAAKITANRERDIRKELALRDLGWRVFTVWECESKGARRSGVVDALAEQIRG